MEINSSSKKEKSRKSNKKVEKQFRIFQEQMEQIKEERDSSFNPSEVGISSMNASFDKGMANIEKCFMKFKDNLLYIRKEFVKQINYYEQINQKLILHHEHLLKLNF